MKKLMLVFLLAVCGLAKAQVKDDVYPSNSNKTEIKQYSASNGITYKVGDTVIFGKGTGVNGRYVFARYGSLVSMMANNGRIDSPDDNMAMAFYINTKQIIKKIVKFTAEGNTRIVFYIKGNTEIYIEEAISECEIKPCKKQGAD